MTPLDPFIGALLVPLAIWIFVSGLDDLFIDLVCFAASLGRKLFRFQSVTPPRPHELERARVKRIAVFVPLWKEFQVIGRMVERNATTANYPAYDFFIGVYPNDELTIKAVTEVASKFPHVHVAMCPHDGPTSKADNLNWVYQRMLQFETQHSCRFEIIVTHDAEDLIHPEEFRWLNYYADRYDMVQIPVLPLPTPVWKFTHGIYCDDFAEFQLRDLPARMILGGFLPSSGVGTGFSRAALEKLAATNHNQIFDPLCLTEDYENGLKLAKLGCPQAFVPVTLQDGYWVATREFFPMSFKTAVKQRARWVTGIALQSWEMNGWGGSLGQAYWFWRDRKGLVGNPISLLANWILMYGVGTWAWSHHSGTAWGLGEQAASPLLEALFWATFLLQFWRTILRMRFVRKIYGPEFAAFVPLRMLWANWVNCFASLTALKRFLAAKLRREKLAWAKTTHAYPSQAGLSQARRQLGEILVKGLCIAQEALEAALASKPASMKLGEYLVSQGLITEQQLYQALSQQQQIPLFEGGPAQVKRRVAQAMPLGLIRKYRVLPVKVKAGNLYVAGPEVPTEQMHTEIRSHVNLEIRFHLVTPTKFQELSRCLLGREKTHLPDATNSPERRLPAEQQTPPGPA